MKIGKKLLALRKLNNFTQDEVASKLNIARSTYANYERNHSQPDLKTLVELSFILNVTTDDLLDIDRDVKLLSKTEKDLLIKFNSLENAQKDDIMDYIDYKKDKNNINSNLA